jgi:Spy/CpxP family protein refolding chaperone
VRIVALNQPAAFLTKLNGGVTRLYRRIRAAGVSTKDRRTVEKEKKKMKIKSFGVALLALMLCGTGALSYAQGPGGFGGHGYEEHMAALLNLTATQKQQIKTLKQAQRATIHPLMQQLGQLHIQMLNATANGAFNQTTIQSIATQEAQVMAQLAVQRESLKSQLYNQVLTTQQKATAEQLRQNEITQINEHLQGSSEAAPEGPAE